MIGPSVVLAGLSLGSGEFILWPYITYKTQFVFFWACLVGVTTQYFINMEVTRWTLATGESAVTGFARLSRHWAWLFLLANVVPWVIPVWGTGAAQIITWLVWPPQLSGEPGAEYAASAGVLYVPWLSIAGLLLCGMLLTAGPVVYRTLEKTQIALVSLVMLLVLIVMVLVVRPDAVMAQLEATATLGYPHFVPEQSEEITAILLLGALAFAGSGGTTNLGQSNYIKDKGFGMGGHVGRITSPITGVPEAISSIGFYFSTTPANMARWRMWWRRACLEHFLSFFVTCAFCLAALTLITYSLFYDAGGDFRPELEQYGKGLQFVYGESIQLEQTTGVIGRWIFLVMGIVILFTTELAVLDVTSRISTDIVKVNWLRNRAWWTESRLYYTFLWGEIAVGIAILAVNHDQVAANTLKNFKIVAALNGGIMCIYSATLLWLNRRFLPEPLRIRGFRIIIMLWSIAFFGFFAIWAVREVLS